MNDAFKTRNRDEWIPILERAGFPFAPELEVNELEHDPQIRHLGVFYETEHPLHGKVKGPHRPILVDGGRDIDYRPPPALGEHTNEILRELGVDEKSIEAMGRAGIV